MVAKLDAYKGASACSSDLLCPLVTGIVASGALSRHVGRSNKELFRFWIRRVIPGLAFGSVSKFALKAKAWRGK